MGRKELWKRFHTLPLQETKPGHRYRSSKVTGFPVRPNFQPRTYLRRQSPYDNSKAWTWRKRVCFQRRILDGHIQGPSESERTEDQVVIRLKIPRETHKPSWSETYGRQYSERLAQQETPFSHGG